MDYHHISLLQLFRVINSPPDQQETQKSLDTENWRLCFGSGKAGKIKCKKLLEGKVENLWNNKGDFMSHPRSVPGQAGEGLEQAGTAQSVRGRIWVSEQEK